MYFYSHVSSARKIRKLENEPVVLTRMRKNSGPSGVGSSLTSWCRCGQKSLSFGRSPYFSPHMVSRNADGA